jgi:uncharacterized repeat protein (TIGR01451 family)
VRRLASLSAAALLALACLAVAPAQAAPRPVTPFLQCVDPTAGPSPGSFVAYFGYSNPNARAVVIRPGVANFVLPPPTRRGQPAVFRPDGDRQDGYVDAATNLAFSAAGTGRLPLAWTLLGNPVTANALSAPCRFALTVRVTADPDTVGPGDEVVFTVTVLNSGSSPIPVGQIDLETTPPIPPARLVSSPPDELLAGEGIVWEVTRTAPAGACGELVEQSADVSIDPGLVQPGAVSIDDDAGRASALVGCVADISLVKVPDAAAVAPGQQAGYSLTVTNQGPDPVPLSAVAVTDPELSSITPPSGPAVLDEGDSATWRGARATSLADCGTLTNVAQATLATTAATDPRTADAAASASISVAGGGCPSGGGGPDPTPPPSPVPPAPAPAPAPVPNGKVGGVDLALAMRGPRRAIAGRVIGIRLVAVNRGRRAARSVRVRDLLPRGFRLAGAGRQAWVRGAFGRRPVWGLGVLAPGERKVVRVAVRAPARARGRIVNRATLSAAGARPVRARLVTRYRARS